VAGTHLWAAAGLRASLVGHAPAAVVGRGVMDHGREGREAVTTRTPPCLLQPLPPRPPLTSVTAAVPRVSSLFRAALAPRFLVFSFLPALPVRAGRAQMCDGTASDVSRVEGIGRARRAAGRRSRGGRQWRLRVPSVPCPAVLACFARPKKQGEKGSNSPSLGGSDACLVGCGARRHKAPEWPAGRPRRLFGPRPTALHAPRCLRLFCLSLCPTAPCGGTRLRPLPIAPLVPGWTASPQAPCMKVLGIAMHGRLVVARIQSTQDAGELGGPLPALLTTQIYEWKRPPPPVEPPLPKVPNSTTLPPSPLLCLCPALFPHGEAR